MIPADLPLEETPEERSGGAPDVPRSLRTEWNVRDSDATLMLRPSGASCPDPGTDWTAACAYRFQRPVIVHDPWRDSAAAVARRIASLKVTTLNVAGPSERTIPGIGSKAERFLTEVFRMRVADAISP
jgi:hypothetical protein